MVSSLKAPFPYFGGKSRVADVVWSRFGADVRNYIEPFCGSAAILLARPDPPVWGETPQRVETVNDLDCYIANFWRAVAADPEAVAAYADWPVTEVDLHARNRWLIERRRMYEELTADPEFFDAKAAGWWVWGISAWFGSGWATSQSKKIPHLRDVGRGVYGLGKRPALGVAGYGVHSATGANMQALAARLRRVRVCSGDWKRVLTPAVTHTKWPVCAVFLDPPYGEKAGRDANIYAKEDLSVAEAVRDWAVERGDDPKWRIALCGFDGEHDMPDTWECVEWRSNGGMANPGYGKGEENRHRERIWFSPHCLKAPDQMTLA